MAGALVTPVTGVGHDQRKASRELGVNGIKRRVNERVSYPEVDRQHVRVSRLVTGGGQVTSQIHDSTRQVDGKVGVNIDISGDGVTGTGRNIHRALEPGRNRQPGLVRPRVHIESKSKAQVSVT